MSFPSILRMARRRAVVMALCIVAVPAAAVAWSMSQQKEYRASAQLLFRDPGFDQKLFGSNAFQPVRDPTREAATNSALVSLDAVAARTSRALGGTLTADEIQDRITVAPQGQADVIGVTAEDTNKRRAARIANTYAEQFVEFRRNADQVKITDAEELVRQDVAGLSEQARQGSQGRDLRQRIQELEVLRALQTGNAELVQPANVPRTAASPRPMRAGAIGLVLGVLLAILVAFLLERVDRRLRDREEVAETFGRPVIGVIPRSRALNRASRTASRLPAREMEAFLLLRANLRYFNITHELNSVLVTSAAPGDGKSTTSKHLAVATVLAEGRALLIEADMRHPVLRNEFDVMPRHGLSNVLAGQLTLGEAIERVPVDETGSAAKGQLDVLFAGPIPPNPTDLIESDRMRNLIAEAENEYDLVVIDTPPTSIVSDAIPLVRMVDGVIIVSRLGQSTRDASAHLRDQLENLGAPVLGVVVNDARVEGSYYAYGYYGSSAPEAHNGTNGHNGAAPERKRDVLRGRDR